MAEDAGLQRAIMASLASHRVERPAQPTQRVQQYIPSSRASGSGGGGGGGHSRDIQPTQPRRVGNTGGTLAKEGIKPRTRSSSSRPGVVSRGQDRLGNNNNHDDAALNEYGPESTPPRRQLSFQQQQGVRHQQQWQSEQQRPQDDPDSFDYQGPSPMNHESGLPPGSRKGAFPPAPPVPKKRVTPSASGAGTANTANTTSGGNNRKPSVPKQQQQPKDASAKAKEGRDQFEALIEDEILDRSPDVQWEDIASLEEPKRLLNEAVVLPMLMPSFFTGIRSPWKGVLLYGPPGTGKTMLAKAVATTGKTTFFNMSSSSLLSRYHGESEKMVRALFTKARELAPSTIFFDEIDALVSSRGDAEHEVTRRVKTELLMQIDGISSVGDKRVMLLATTNRPWDIDEAMRRRLEKRIYVPLPDLEARESLFRLYTKTLKFVTTPDGPAHEEGLDELAKRSQGYSGADIQIMCRDAAMMPLRRAIMGLSPAELAAKSAELEASQHNMMVDLELDFLGSALKNVKASVGTKDLQQYEEWTAAFSSV